MPSSAKEALASGIGGCCEINLQITRSAGSLQLLRLSRWSRCTRVSVCRLGDFFHQHLPLSKRAYAGTGLAHPSFHSWTPRSQSAPPVCHWCTPPGSMFVRLVSPASLAAPDPPATLWPSFAQPPSPGTPPNCWNCVFQLPASVTTSPPSHSYQTNLTHTRYPPCSSMGHR